MVMALMNPRLLIIIFVILFGLILFLIIWSIHIGRPFNNRKESQPFFDNVPTLFIPGYFGNRFSFGFLLKRLVRRYDANKSMVIIVKRNGCLRLYGNIKNQRCVIQVLFENKTSRPKQQAAWLNDICQMLETDYQIHHLNLVGHSMGCITIFWYLTHQHRKAAIMIDRVVAIAGPFNDSEIARNTPIVDSVPLTATGPIHRRPIFSALSANISTLPTTIKVLNIAGRISDRQKDDGQVSVNSAFSLRFLLKRPLGYYRELIIRGRRASHRLLHENQIVDESIVNFLWK
ncbi:alpha/beta hydrolase [Lentilactobacillus hilgardii]|uniref:Alpha/beta hydrolase n=2 Tax=Lentilactobacillus hilgardii TaxID=1588 RepID=C0XG09_LENH9|nr:alpha/beta hydrolase [Lentilactobacillus hilgardii]EEI25725.1 hypothetical protein HMPREF0519_0170 [Lentilactobacillus hilgardii DSM 20176 = ATCC 8290]KRK56417.1 alpha beta hydrolase [Lentilactobacillus hilgardii DSM 20176 = ATCC 8290]QEU38926.1 alpha/beta hydrolase [Lentilactobacillus hilgardii]TDG80323.1 hypothetical protein C5L34_000213 [Lentilactobacillus hilgardii]